MKTKVNLLLIATNKYVQYLQPLIDSCDKYFLTDCEVVYNIFTDQQPQVVTDREVQIHPIEHKPFPYPTLMRFKFFTDNWHSINNGDYVYYLDVDTIITATITQDNIISDLVAVKHCGFINKRGSYETRKKSACYVDDNEGVYYYGGGFWGGSTWEIYKMVTFLDNMINQDLDNGIIPVFHDESALNKYLVSVVPTKILSPSYHYPQSNIEYYKNIWGGLNFDCKILLLDKNHKEMRE